MTARRGAPNRKRGNGDGSLYLRRDGRWVASITLEGGVRRTYYGRTRLEVRQKLSAALRAKADGLLVPRADRTVAAYLEQWLEDMAKPSVRPRTFESYSLNVRRLRPQIGRIRLNDLTPAAIQAAYGALLRRGLSPRSVIQAHAVLHRALRQAVQWGLLPRNPVDAVSRPRPKRTEIRTLSVREVKQLFETSRNDRLHALWVLLSTTGLRLGEALGLMWKDLNLDQGTVSVQRALQRERGVGFVLVEPKTEHSRRRVYLAPGTIATLTEHRRLQAQDRLVAGPGWESTHDLIFRTQVGRPIEGGQVSWAFHKVLEKAKLPRIRLHDLRHTAASQLLERGVHPKVVQEMLGHSTITLTLDTYSHIVPGLQAQVAEQMQRLFQDREADQENSI